MGYLTAYAVEGPPKPGLLCKHCEGILRSPVQTEEGIRLCRDCFDEIGRMDGCKCMKCDVSVSSNKSFRDKAVQREVLELRFWCPFKNSGCLWQGQLRNWEEHVEGCSFNYVSCPHGGCGQLITRSHLEDHVRECLYCMMKDETWRQESGSAGMSSVSSYTTQANFPKARSCGQVASGGEDMLLGITCEVKRDSSKPVPLVSRDEELVATSYLPVIQESLHSKSKPQVFLSLWDMRPSPREHVNNQVNLSRPLRETMSVPSSRQQPSMLSSRQQPSMLSSRQQPSMLSSRQQPSMLSSRQQLCEDRMKELQAKVEKLTDVTQTGMQRLEKAVEEIKERQDLAQHCHELEKKVTSMKIQVSELELQLQTLQSSTHNGTLIWRIPNISQLRKKATDKHVTSIYSPPFYSGRNGYKMCVCAYLNGDGMGYQTHLSLYFVIMCGEHDNVLKWPFTQKVSMILVDQTHRKHIVQTFKPTPECQSFQQPKTEMNVASGCPQFAKLNVLDDPSFVKDDVMFIKCIVDISNIFHP